MSYEFALCMNGEIRLLINYNVIKKVRSKIDCAILMHCFLIPDIRKQAQFIFSAKFKVLNKLFFGKILASAYSALQISNL